MFYLYIFRNDLFNSTYFVKPYSSDAGHCGLTRKSAAARLLWLSFEFHRGHGCLSWVLCVR